LPAKGTIIRMISFPNAKINIGLRVLSKRDDGFHTIESVFYPIPFHDMLEVVELKNWQTGKPKWQFTSYGIAVDGPAEDNLCVRAYETMSAYADLPPVDIYLYKKIPMGAGLGGGSADAAFMLKLLNDKFEMNLTQALMKQMASTLGSDCTFFIDNEPAYLVGKGHELEPFSIHLKGLWLVLLTPPVHSSTKLAYSKVTPRNTFSSSLKELLSQPLERWHTDVVNDFELSVFSQFPELASYKKQLYECGAAYACMSGSGSSIFGLFREQPTLTDGLQHLCACNVQL
jgi:4-diphosphocytidyl-2-C-methyl-D-erythritol kinase